MYDYAVKTLYV